MFLKKLKRELPYDLAILLLGIYSEKTIIQRDTCTPMFIAALFTIARTWKQPRCPQTDEWIKNIWYTSTMESAKSLQSCPMLCDPIDGSPPGSTVECYSAIKKDEHQSFVERGMDLESAIRVK